jgi:hypothetical protein
MSAKVVAYRSSRNNPHSPEVERGTIDIFLGCKPNTARRNAQSTEIQRIYLLSCIFNFEQSRLTQAAAKPPFSNCSS